MLVGFIISCTVLSNKSEKFIIGSWAGTYIDSPVSYGEKTYFENGTTCGFILDSPYKGDPGGLYTYQGKWRIENNVLISTAVKSNAPGVEVDKEIKDEIVSIDKLFLVLKSVDDGTTYTRHRVLEDRFDNLCKVAPQISKP